MSCASHEAVLLFHHRFNYLQCLIESVEAKRDSRDARWNRILSPARPRVSALDINNARFCDLGFGAFAQISQPHKQTEPNTNRNAGELAHAHRAADVNTNMSRATVNTHSRKQTITHLVRALLILPWPVTLLNYHLLHWFTRHHIIFLHYTDFHFKCIYTV